MMQHLLDIGSIDPQQLQSLLKLAAQVSASPLAFANRLRDRILINLFMEPSTRTRMSFEIAAKRLGMHVINFQPNASSAVKGEILEDTFQTLQALRPDVIVIRHSRDGAVATLAETAQTHVINAGDGCANHPTQALLDALTLQQVFGDLKNIKLTIVGDISHSRVARSDIVLFRQLGMQDIRLAGPPGLLNLDGIQGLSSFNQLEEAITGVNVIMVLRIQRERFGELALPDEQAWFADWGLTQQRLGLAAENCVIMHPGPVNRGVEIATEVVDGRQSLIKTQVSNGVFTRMAVLMSLLDRKKNRPAPKEGNGGGG